MISRLTSLATPTSAHLNTGMEAINIHQGREYGYGETPRRQDDLQKVRVAEKVRSKWKVEWIESNPGLTDYVKSVNLVVPWGERRTFLRDEGAWGRLVSTCRETWPGHDHPLADAAETVFDAMGEAIGIGSNGVTSASQDVLQRLGARIGAEIPITPPGYKSRDGQVHMTFDEALWLAQMFARAEPEAVLLAVETTQRRYESEAKESGNSHLVPLVQRWRAGWALCRQWAGFDQALSERDAEIERLRRIIVDLGYDLRRLGQDDLARRLDGKLKNA